MAWCVDCSVSVKWFVPLAITILLQPSISHSLSMDAAGKMWDRFKIPIDWSDIEPMNISKTCHEKLNNISTNDLRKAIDAFGKVPAGVLVGNLGWLGHFDECENITNFQYCLVDFNVTISPKNIKYLKLFTLTYGLCVPIECTPNDVIVGINDFLADVLPIQDEVKVNNRPLCTEMRQPLNVGFFISVVLLCLLFLVVVSSSIYFTCQESQVAEPRDTSVNLHTEASQGETTPLFGPSASVTIESGVPGTRERQTERQESKLEKVIHSFALPKNLPALMSGKTSSNTINCLNGMRVITMLWVILAQVFVYIGTFTEAYNPQTGKTWFARFMFTLISNSYFAIDSFFCFSGLLVTYITLNRMKKRNGRFAWRWFYFHRYWRLAPTLAVTMVFYILITPYFGRGPFAQMLSSRMQCSKYWWTNLLFINNFYPESIEDECMPWVWFLATNMQFYIITPLILIPLYYIPVIGFSLMSILLISCIIVICALTSSFSIPAVPGIEGSMDYWNIIYTKPYCRISPYLLGILLGFIFFRYPKGSVKMNWKLSFLGWTLFGTLGGAIQGFVRPHYSDMDWSLTATVVYLALSRLIWTTYVGWVAFACHYGFGGWINGVLSHGLWVPLSRLTYSAYLLHPIIILLYLSNIGEPPYLSLQLMSFNFAGISLITYVCACVLTLMVEYPLANLEKIFLQSMTVFRRICSQNPL